MRTRSSFVSKPGSTKAGPYAGALMGGLIGYLAQHGGGGSKSRGNARKNVAGKPQVKGDAKKMSGRSSHAKGEYGNIKNSMHQNAGTGGSSNPVKPQTAMGNRKKKATMSTGAPKPSRKPRRRPMDAMKKKAKDKGFDFGKAIRRGFGRV